MYITVKIRLLIGWVVMNHIFKNSYFSFLCKQVIFLIYYHFLESLIFLEVKLHFLNKNLMPLVMDMSVILFRFALTKFGRLPKILFFFHSSEELYMFVDFLVSEPFSALFSLLQILIFQKRVGFLGHIGFFVVLKLHFFIEDFDNVVFLYFL